MSGGRGGSREIACRLFAAEYDDADFSYAESDEERAPNYVVTPTGARINRLFVVGVLTEVEPVNEEMLRARVVDPTGAFVVYAGQYQPDELAFLEEADPPAFVAVTGKARTFQPEDSDRVYTSVRPESIAEVDVSTRDRWTVQTAERTLERTGIMAGALASDQRGEALEAALREQGVAGGLAAGIPLAIEHYGTSATYLEGVRDLAVDALRVVAGEQEEVTGLNLSPDASGDVMPGDLADLDVPDRPAAPVDSGEGPGETAVETRDVDDGGARNEQGATPTGTETQAAEQSPGADQEIDDLGDFDAEEFELDAEERRDVEETYGTEFETGTEVEDPGDADVSDASETAAVQSDEAETPQATVTGGVEPAQTGDAAEQEGAGDSDEGDEAPAGDDDRGPAAVDLETAVVSVMRDLDEGEGADRTAVVEAVATERGVDEAEVDAAIDDALMGGQCYEPAEGRLKAI